ncbi:MAG: inositol monophosphatase [Bacteroidota bacterium]|nr:inositol monophosphatase [Bacteroidota bacterium]
MIPEKARDTLDYALKKSGEVLMMHLGLSSEVTVKESISSVVTEADLASEKVILELLQDSAESYNVITEESGYLDNGSDYTWVIDPLDGTSNFAAGLPWFGVIIALLHKEIPLLGGMYLPVYKELYTTELNRGSWKNGEAIRVTDSDSLAEHLLAYSFDFSDVPGKTESEMEVLNRLSKKVRNIRSTNSLVDFCYTADGRLGAAVNQTTKIWDIAVPWLMIREGGGKVTDIQGQEIHFDLSAKTFDRNYTIMASGSRLFDSLMSTIEILHP